MTKWIVKILGTLGLIILLAYLLLTYVITPLGVNGHSMEPTLHYRDRVWVLRITDHQFQRGKLIVLKAPDQKDTLYVKRVIGVGGDTIRYKDDNLYINGSKYDEPYLKGNRLKALKGAKKGTYYMQNYTVHVPKGYVYVLGDNRLYSDDSRNYGAVKAQDVVGKVVIVPKVRNYSNILDKLS